MRNLKLRKLEDILGKMRSVVIAYSGGLDSTFLVKTAYDVLGKKNVLAVTARSETYPGWEFREAKALAKKIGVKQVIIKTHELKNSKFRANPVERCYYCKKELFRSLDAIRKKRKMNYVLDGTNLDDLKDIRHGRKAAAELGVRSPLLEARITKNDIRKFSRALKLPTWSKPSFACLASRVPFGHAIEEKTLVRIDKAESFIRGLGICQARVRAHETIARIEVSPKDFPKIVKFGDKLIAKLTSLGFTYITLDLKGYRTGSMHEAKV